jgi:tetratricopeptide (TPR) repeat protein
MNDLDLDAIGILEETDKTSLGWDYLRHYEQEFARFRHQDINLIEIGVFRGASLNVWEKYFSRATIVGIDIMPDCTVYEGGRKVVAIGSQIDPDFLAGVTAKYPPTIIVDDGSHIADHVQVSFEVLFPRLLPGGCYVIEDVTAHRPDSHYRGTAALDTPDFVLRLAALVLLRRVAPDLSPALAAAVREIDTVSLIGSAAYVWKKPPLASAATIAAKQALVERSKSAMNWQGLAKFIMSQRGPLEQAAAAARRAIELRPKDWDGHNVLGLVLDRKGDLAGALAATQAAARLRPNNAQLQTRLANLEKRLARATGGA